MSKSNKGKKDASPMMIGDAALYQIQNNGGRPFTVLVDEMSRGGTRVRVYKTRQVFNEEWDIDADVSSEVYAEIPPKPKELLVTWKNLKQVWIPRCPSLYANESEALGNSILIHLSSDAKTGRHSYIHIGSMIYKFTSKEPITEYESPIDNNNVPYPSALSETEVFFLIDMQRLPREKVKEIVLEADSALKELPSDALRWVLMHENLYGTVKERKKWRADGFDFHPDAKPLEGVEELFSGD